MRTNRRILLKRLLPAMFSLLLIPALSFAQNDSEAESSVDTAMAYSPDYMPTSTARFPTINFNPLIYSNIDTSLFHTAEYDPLWEIKNLYQSLGINGQAHKPMLFGTVRPAGFSMMRNPNPLYFRTFDDILLYNMKTSYTNIGINYSLVDEMSFLATHAQQIRQVNFSLNMDGVRNSGYFLNQGANRFNLDGVLRYETPKKIYGFILGYIFSHGKFGENGGLENSAEFTNRNPREQETDNILTSYPVFFTYGVTTVNAHYGQLTNYVNIMNNKGHYFGTFTHTLNFDHFDSEFHDHTLNNRFYKDTYYYSTDTTNDSIQYYRLANTLQWSNYSPVDTIGDRPYYFRFAGGVRHEFVNAASPHYVGNSVTAFGRVSMRLFKVWELYGNIAYSFFGYTNNDATATAGARFLINKKHRHFICLETAFDRFSPDYIFTSYSGNNNLWDNNFGKQNFFRASAFWTIFGYKVGFAFHNLGHYTFLNNDYIPIQSEKQIQVIQLTAFAPVRIKDFSLDANLALQHSTNPAVSVPLFAGKLSAAYHTRIFKKRLHFQIGIDVLYNTIYHSDGYNAILHQFYSQKYETTGNYVYLNAHLALRVKRLSFYIRGGNLLAGLFNFKYITTPGYPMQGRNMELGIRWKFYD